MVGIGVCGGVWWCVVVCGVWRVVCGVVWCVVCGVVWCVVCVGMGLEVWLGGGKREVVCGNSFGPHLTVIVFRIK